MRFKTLYISWPSYSKQQREITTICVVCGPKPRRKIILISIWNSRLLLYVMLKLRCDAVGDGKLMQPFLKFWLKAEIHFLIDVFLGVAKEDIDLTYIAWCKHGNHFTFLHWNTIPRNFKNKFRTFSGSNRKKRKLSTLALKLKTSVSDRNGS